MDAGTFENNQEDHLNLQETVEMASINSQSVSENTIDSIQIIGSVKQTDSNADNVDIVYSVLDVPPMPTTLMLSVQQFFTISCSIIPVPFVICPVLCMANDDPGGAFILSTMYFVCGFMTIIQIIFGVRLPIVQGVSASFLTPILSIMSLPQFQCPQLTGGINSTNQTGVDSLQDPEIWHYRIRELQGSIAVSSVMQILLSTTGLLSLVLPYITPLVVIPTLTMIGLGIIESATVLSRGNWAISLCTTLLVILSSQHLQNVSVPYPTYQRGKGFTLGWIEWFKFFPIITALIIMWVICAILTAYDILPVGSTARTDTVANVITNTEWFRVPYPGQWGVPTTSVPSAIGMLSASFAVVIESIGTYFACALLTDVPAPPPHAVNRGVFVQGISCLMAGLFGAGSGLTAFPESVGAMSLTKVGSRIVILIASVHMLIFGVMTKFTAVIISMPKPIMGGLMTVSFSLIAGIGLSTAQYINLNSSRNIFILGFSLWFGISMPGWVSQNASSIKTGSYVADEVITILLSTSMFVGGLSGFLLDNTIPGSAADRGLTKWMKFDDESNVGKRADASLYDLPFGMDFIRRINIFRYIPICPTFRQPKINSSKNL